MSIIITFSMISAHFFPFTEICPLCFSELCPLFPLIYVHHILSMKYTHFLSEVHAHYFHWNIFIIVSMKYIPFTFSIEIWLLSFYWKYNNVFLLKYAQWSTCICPLLFFPMKYAHLFMLSEVHVCVYAHIFFFSVKYAHYLECFISCATTSTNSMVIGWMEKKTGAATK